MKKQLVREEHVPNTIPFQYFLASKYILFCFVSSHIEKFMERNRGIQFHQIKSTRVEYIDTLAEEERAKSQASKDQVSNLSSTTYFTLLGKTITSCSFNIFLYILEIITTIPISAACFRDYKITGPQMALYNYKICVLYT